MIRVVERPTRKQRACGGCGGTIQRGARYRACTASPGEDYTDPDRWSHLDMHLEGECWGGTGDQLDLALEVEWREYQTRSAVSSLTFGATS